MEKPYRGVLKVALANSGGVDSGTISTWAEDLRRADDALDSAIAAAVRGGDSQVALELADRGAALQACATFLDKLFNEMEGTAGD